MESRAVLPFLIISGLYLFPTFVAVARAHHRALPILLLNLFLGWTIVGWIAAFAWFLSGFPRLMSEAKPVSLANRRVVVLALAALALLGMYHLHQRWLERYREYALAHYQGLLPEGLDIERPIASRSDFSMPILDREVCGGAFLTLKKETSVTIKKEGLRFFANRQQARNFPEGKRFNLRYRYKLWLETPLPDDVRNSSEWSRALGCMELDAETRRRIDELVRAPGSYWSTRHEVVTVVLPHQRAVILTYDEY